MTKLRFVFASLIGLAVVCVLIPSVGSVRAAGADHVTWDIIHFVFATPPTPNAFFAGGFADATAPNNGGRIRVSGSGAFVAPSSGGGSNAATGRGTWQTFNSAGTPTGSGTYVVRELVEWSFASSQAGGPNIDNIGPGPGANGHAYLGIDYDDGSQGVLGVFCHGFGAPNGIAEGISATKGVVTYTAVGAPAPNVDLNRTVFHVTK